jgi:hypothetical protein
MGPYGSLRIGVGNVILLPLHKRLNINRRDQANFVAFAPDVTNSTMPARTGLHRNHAARLRRQKG